MDRKRSGADVLAGFVAGFEVGAQLGLDGAGLELAQRGWHPTSILGHMSATAACAALLELEPAAIERALGFAAVQAGGLMSSAGTMSKAFLVGKAAMNGVMAAQLAENGALAPTHLLEGPQGLFATLFQREFVPRMARLGHDWQITQNTYKPYPACQLVHASFEAASAMSRRLDGRSIRKIRAFVNPFALTIAKHRSPRTPLEARFSLNYCIALGLLGYRAAMDDFSETRVADSGIRELSRRVQAVPDDTVERSASRLEITCDDGHVLTETVAAALGSPGRPMGWPELESKFLAAASPVIGDRSHDLLAALESFDQPDALAQIEAIVSGARRSR
jgi:2-methylcitrate dehydratase PrpD